MLAQPGAEMARIIDIVLPLAKEFLGRLKFALASTAHPVHHHPPPAHFARAPSDFPPAASSACCEHAFARGRRAARRDDCMIAGLGR